MEVLASNQSQGADEKSGNLNLETLVEMEEALRKDSVGNKKKERFVLAIFFLENCQLSKLSYSYTLTIFSVFFYIRSRSSSVKASSSLEEILNSIIPPREYKENDVEYIQYASKEPSTRPGVLKLQGDLDAKLVERQAREVGICPVREDLYTQAFDEIIRQVALAQPERGLLLLRVRDENRMTMDAYKTLYDSSVTFGIRKQLQAEHGMSLLEEQLKELEGKKSTLETKMKELVNSIELMEKQSAEQRNNMQKKRKAEIEFLEYEREHYQMFLKSTQSQ